MQAHIGRRPTTNARRLSRGLYCPDGRDLLDDLRAWQLVLPRTAAFTHLTAARAYGLWLPPLPDPVPTFVAQHVGDPRSRRPGLVVSRHREPPTVQVRDGVRLAPPATALLACARDLGLIDLVMLCDSALANGLCGHSELTAVADGGSRGAPVLRRAVALADARSESPWESVLRLLHHTAGAEVIPQHVVVADDGTFVARGDLWVAGTRTLHEYDGAGHRLAAQQRQDLRRDRRLVAAGWTRRGYTNRDLVEGAAGVMRDIDLALGRSSRPEHLRRWHALVATSSISPAGRARLARRLAARARGRPSRAQVVP